MEIRGGLALELIHRAPLRRAREPTLLFVHGAYVGAWCWDVHFLGDLAARGFPSYALSLRGHGESPGGGDCAAAGIDEYVEDVEQTVARIGRPLVLIGHSMGGLLVTRFLARSPLARTHALGAILMAPVPAGGLTPVTTALALQSPSLLAELNQVQHGRPHFGDLKAIRRALFSAAVDDAVARSYFRRMQPESQRALIEMSMLHLLPPAPAPACPMLVLGAANDGFFAPAWITASARALAAPCEIVPDMAHAMMLEPGWRTVADRIAAWVGRLVGR